jgi:hypothetical protein
MEGWMDGRMECPMNQTSHSAVDFAPQTRLCVRHLRFTLTANHWAIIPGAMDFDPATFPNATSTTVCVRALMLNGNLAAGLTKHFTAK